MRWVIIALITCAGVSLVANAQAAEISRPKFRQVVTNSIGITFRLVPAGSITFGEGKDAREVVVEQPFYLGVTEVTNGQGKAIMGFVPSKQKNDQKPIESVSWHEAMAFCQQLSGLQAERIAGRSYRLPTEAEWVYACRAGSKTKYSFGDDESLLGFFAWYADNTPHTQKVATRRPNDWGFFDMHGNVAEWCSDGEEVRVVRGGQWNKRAGQCTSGSRYGLAPTKKDWAVGFRLAMSPPGIDPPSSP